MGEFEVTAGYDKRFGTVGFRFQGAFRANLREFLKQLGVTREEALAILVDDEYQWTEGTGDIEKARVRLIAETDVEGKVVLDVGGYDGVMAKQCLDQGAKRAICLDNHQYEHYGWEDRKLDGVEYIQGDLTIWKEPVDVVIAYNILYHTHHPWRMLNHIRDITKEQMLLCTLFRYHTGSWIYLYDPRECNPTDETVYFGPSLEALNKLLNHTGWNSEQYALTYDRVLYRCLPDLEFIDKHPEPLG